MSSEFKCSIMAVLSPQPGPPGQTFQEVVYLGTIFRCCGSAATPFRRQAAVIEAEAVSHVQAGSAAGFTEAILCGMGIAGCNDIGTALLKIGQIIIADIILSGDNALVIAMAAAGLPLRQRRIAIISGLALAAVMRIVFAVIATILLKIPGILFLGGLLLSWVCLRLYKDLGNFNNKPGVSLAPAAESSAAETPAAGGVRPLMRALATITLADVSMSLDNVIAVAAIAREDTAMLIMGLALAICLMAFCAAIIMKVLARFPALSWAGLAFLCYLTAVLLYDGAIDIAVILGLM